MSGSLNRVSLIGNLGKDPDVRSTQDGRKIVNLTVATSESWKDKRTGERKERTEWHRVVIFSEGLAEVAQNFLSKGSKVFLEGALQTRKWTDNSGVEKYSTEVVLQGFDAKMVLLDRPGEKPLRSEASPSQAIVTLDDQIPFALALLATCGASLAAVAAQFIGAIGLATA